MTQTIKNFFLRSTLLISSSALAMTMSSFAQADILQDIYNTVSAISKNIVGIAQYIQNQSYVAAPEDNGIKTLNSASLGINTGGTQGSSQLNNEISQNLNGVVATLLAPNPNVLDAIHSNLILRPAADYPVKSDQGPVAYSINGVSASGDPRTLMQQGNADYSLDSLIGPVAYNLGPTYTWNNPPPIFPAPLPTDHAMTFILNLANLSYPLAPESYQDFLAKNSKITMDDVVNNDQVQRYRSMVHHYTTIQTTALNNLLHMYYERLPIRGLAQTAQIPYDKNGNPNANASLMQVDEYRATRRLNPQWYNDMQKAPPATIARENLYLQAEMLDEIYKLRQEIERENATQSASLLVSSSLLIDNIKQQQDAAEEAITNLQATTPQTDQ